MPIYSEINGNFMQLHIYLDQNDFKLKTNVLIFTKYIFCMRNISLKLNKLCLHLSNIYLVNIFTSIK